MNGYRGGFGGGFGGANLQNLMRQAQKMQEDMQKSKEEIENTDFTASVGGGMVSVVIGGNRRVKRIDIKPEVVDPDDIEMLTDLISAGVNDALAQIEQAEKDKLPQMPAGF
ncbi:MAG: YbaB/EbfC family nucleoid-associated protein [Clostridia bacterium]|nr:YbaB/EbfC family nucleoid-associated protein [Clostridia bacterium]